MPTEVLKERKLDRDALAIHIMETLHRLPSPLREVFELSHYENVSTRGIAERLDLEPAEVETLKDRSDRMFLELLGPIRIE